MSFDDVKSVLRGFYKARVLHFFIVLLLLFFILFRRIFVLQIVDGDSYDTDFSVRTKQTMTVSGAKGDIYDRNGVLLAYNELVYTVDICDSGRYEDNEEKNQKLNKIIYDMCHIITGYGDKVNTDLIIGVDALDEYVFECEEGEKMRFFRDIFGRKSVNELTDKEKAYTAAETIDYLCERFEIDEKQYSKKDIIYIIYFRNLMKNNSYQRYLKFNVANDVCERTVATILENSEELTGVTISRNYVRKYVDTKYFSHIIGYTGRVSQDELSELKEQDESYEANDIVGKSGIEKAMELELTGDKGVQEVYVDNVGRVTEIISETKPTKGNDIYLSIDAELTKKVYDEIELQLSRLILSKITLGGEESRYQYNAYGDITDVFIPINDVYFSIIDNNMVSIAAFETSDYDNQRGIYRKFDDVRSQVIDRLRTDLKDGDTPLKELPKDMAVYEYYIYQYLLNNSIITRSRLDINDEVYKKWFDESISLKEFLVHAISSNWVDVLKITDETYQSLYETYDSLLEYILEKIPYDEGFQKKIYKYLVADQVVTGRELCMCLYEQGVLKDNGEYDRLKNYGYSAYDFMINKITNLEITPAMMALKPCSASVVLTHPKTGELIAMVSYPGYDNNMMSGTVDPEYYKKLRNDKSLPLINRATQSLCAPGSTYKINTSIAGVCEGVLGMDESLYCGGIYKTVTPSPRCWAYPGGHGWVDMTHAIMHSCNCFFYEVGYRLSIDSNGNFSNELGTTRLAKYAKLLGLGTKSGIEIGEAEPHPSDINSIASAIGQGSNNFLPINLARYVTTIATKGTCYNLSLISKIVAPSGDTVYNYEPKVNNVCDFVSEAVWSRIHEGMRLVLDNNIYFAGLGFAVAGKTGTAQENLKEPNHALLISFGPLYDPEIACACVIQNGYISSNAQMLTGEIYKIYFNQKKDEQPVINSGNTVND